VISNSIIPIQNQRPHIPNVDIFSNEFMIGFATGLEGATTGEWDSEMMCYSSYKVVFVKLIRISSLNQYTRVC
jgi:hypothetical protein